MKTCASLIFVLCAVALANADTTWVAGGAVSGIWTVEGSPYIVQDDISISLGDTLIVGSGVRIFFEPTQAMTVFGFLKVNGQPADSVVFTADIVQNPYGWGGLRFVNAEDTSIVRYAILENGRYADYGGGVYCIGSNVHMEHSVIRSCDGGFGKALYVEDQSHVIMRHCEISDNGTQGGCGAIRVAFSSLVLDSCRVLRNRGMDGAGLCLYNAQVMLRNCDFEDNAGWIWGGAIFASGTSAVSASGCTFKGNSSLQGGAIDVVEQATLEADHCLFIGNRGMHDQNNGAAGAIYASGNELNVTNCTFVGNSAPMYGCIYADDDVEIRNSIVAETEGDDAIRLAAPGAVIAYCDFYRNAESDVVGNVPDLFGNQDTVNANLDTCDRLFNLFIDPLLADPEANDYSLDAASPCIDSGDPESPLDPDGSVADMGALYFHQELDAKDSRSVASPASLNLSAYPNPFNAVTQIEFSLPRDSYVQISLFEITGRLVTTLAAGRYEAGTHVVTLDAHSLPSGVYVYRLEADASLVCRKLLLLK